MPEKPAEPLNPVMVSDGVTGTAAITLGAEEQVYPRPVSYTHLTLPTSDLV